MDLLLIQVLMVNFISLFLSMNTYTHACNPPQNTLSILINLSLSEALINLEQGFVWCGVGSS